MAITLFCLNTSLCSSHHVNRHYSYYNIMTNCANNKKLCFFPWSHKTHPSLIKMNETFNYTLLHQIFSSSSSSSSVDSTNSLALFVASIIKRLIQLQQEPLTQLPRHYTTQWCTLTACRGKNSIAKDLQKLQQGINLRIKFESKT